MIIWQCEKCGWRMGNPPVGDGRQVGPSLGKIRIDGAWRFCCGKCRSLEVVTHLIEGWEEIEQLKKWEITKHEKASYDDKEIG